MQGEKDTMPDPKSSEWATRAGASDLESALDRYCEAAQTTQRVLGGARLKNWALFSTAAGSAFALASSAEAAVIYSGVQNIMVTRTGTLGSDFQNVDLNGDGADDVAIHLLWSGGTAAADLKGLTSPGAFVKTFGLGNSASRLSSSSSVSIGLNGGFASLGLLRFANSASTIAGIWPGGNPTATSGFAGVQFADTGFQLHTGWLRLELHNDANGAPDKLTLIDWAYESVSGAPIHVADVPEPSSLALLAAGAAGLLAFRTRRRGKK